MTDNNQEVPDVPKEERYEIHPTFGRMSTNAWSDRLRWLYEAHVKASDPELGWKGPCYAEVPQDLAADVNEAMCFMGSIVDLELALEDGRVRLMSEGYYHHIGA